MNHLHAYVTNRVFDYEHICVQVHTIGSASREKIQISLASTLPDTYSMIMWEVYTHTHSYNMTKGLNTKLIDSTEKKKTLTLTQFTVFFLLTN